MTRPRIPLPHADASLDDCPASGDGDVEGRAQENFVYLHQRRDEHARGSNLCPAREQFTDYRERMLCIRQRVADGAYDAPTMMNEVARRILDRGALR